MNNNNKHNEKVIDKYAQNLLYALDNQVEESLGSYITGCIRKSDTNILLNNNDDETIIESLIELIQEHCTDITSKQAYQTLQSIATAVYTNTIPTIVNNNNNNNNNIEEPTLGVDDLLPVDLLDDDDENDTNTEEKKENATAATNINVTNTTTVTSSVGPSSTTALSSDIASDDSSSPLLSASFPPLEKTNIENQNRSTSSNGGKKFHPKHHHHHKGHHSKKHNNDKNNAEAEELAMSLFQTTTRSRQSSIDESTFSNSACSNSNPSTKNNSPLFLSQQQQQQQTELTNHTTVNNTFTTLPPQSSQQSHQQSMTSNNNNHYEHEQENEMMNMIMIQNVTEMLLSFNIDLSEDAAYTAATMAHGDINIAQYIIEQATQQTPVCRHLLTDGCYRADCTFSHDIDAHTCMFWLKKVCTKGTQCKFLHGFSHVLLEQLPIQQQQYNTNENNNHDINNYNNDYQHQQQQQTYTDESGNVYSMDGVLLYDNNTIDMSNYVDYGTNTQTPSWMHTQPQYGTSFVNVATQGYDTQQSFANDNSITQQQYNNNNRKVEDIPTVPIPQDLWNAHENRDSSVFYLYADPLERYYTVMSSHQHQTYYNIIDLHFQSLQTFTIVLDTILPQKLLLLSSSNSNNDYYNNDNNNNNNIGVWIITGTGHHVGTRTHQKSGGTLEYAVLQYLINNEYYNIKRGKDKNGQGGAILVQR